MSWWDEFDWGGYGREVEVRGELRLRRALSGRYGWAYTQVRPTYAEVVELLGVSAPGSWREVASWPYVETVWGFGDGWSVPLLAPEPERAAWRRRKWWGPVSPWPTHLDAAITMAGRVVVSRHYRAGRRRSLFVVANDGGVCEPLLWTGDQA